MYLQSAPDHIRRSGLVSSESLYFRSPLLSPALLVPRFQSSELILTNLLTGSCPWPIKAWSITNFMIVLRGRKASNKKYASGNQHRIALMPIECSLGRRAALLIFITISTGARRHGLIFKLPRCAFACTQISSKYGPKLLRDGRSHSNAMTH